MSLDITIIVHYRQSDAGYKQVSAQGDRTLLKSLGQWQILLDKLVIYMTITNDIKNEDSIPVVSELVAGLFVVNSADGIRFTLESVAVKLASVATVVVLPTSKKKQLVLVLIKSEFGAYISICCLCSLCFHIEHF